MTTDHASMYQYFVNAIPTTYIDDKGNTIKSYQYHSYYSSFIFIELLKHII